MFKRFVILFLSFIFLGFTWMPLPLTTEKQRDVLGVGGEGMQMIWGLEYAQTNPNILYLVSDTSQTWKSTDGGQSWKIKHVGFRSNGGISLKISPSDENVVFVAGSVHRTKNTSPSEGIYRTLNGGDTWELVYQTAFYRISSFKGGINFDFYDENTIYAGTHEDGLLKSTDKGDTWVDLNILENEKILDLKIHPTNKNILYVSTEIGLYKFTNEISLEPIGNLPDFPRTIVINENYPNIIYASVGKFGVFKSIDGGNTFESSNVGLEWPLNNNKKTTYLAISKTNPDYLYVYFYYMGGKSIFYTHNGGNNWYPATDMDKGNLMKDITLSSGGHFHSGPIAIHPTNSNIAIISATKANLVKTEDGGQTWEYSGKGRMGARAGIGNTSFGWDNEDHCRFAIFTIDHGIMLSLDFGWTFKNISPKINPRSTPVGIIDQEIIVTALGSWGTQKIYITRDEGNSWESIDGTEDSYKFISFHKQDHNIIYAGKWKSLDKGLTWFELSEKVIGIFEGNGDIVYAKKGISQYQSTILKSIDGGISWTQPYGNIPRNVSGANEIAIDPNDENRIYVTNYWRNLFIWDGSIWKEIELEMDSYGSKGTKNVIVDPNDSNIVYVGKFAGWKGQSNGILKSMDKGLTWENITYNLGPEFTPWSLSICGGGHLIVGSSHGTWFLLNIGD